MLPRGVHIPGRRIVCGLHLGHSLPAAQIPHLHIASLVGSELCRACDACLSCGVIGLRCKISSDCDGRDQSRDGKLKRWQQSFSLLRGEECGRPGCCLPNF